ncbi:MAG: hypothetical protein AAF517_22065 [Planctomycetota bacterium]
MLTRLFVAVVATSLLAACNSVPDPIEAYGDDAHKPLASWQEIYVSPPGGGVSKAVHRGYLSRRHTLANREGVFVVTNLQHEEIGFVLPSGEAYMYGESVTGEREPKMVSLSGVDSGILKLLGYPGIVSLKNVSPGTEPGSTDKKMAKGDG